MTRDRRSPQSDDVAIVGLSCRFPHAEGLEPFWRLLASGGDAIEEVPAERWDLAAVYRPGKAVPGKVNTRWGGFLQGVDLFDAGFFAISPREAARMDPQHRMLLEVAWEALEDAGLLPGQLRGARGGVFLGQCYEDYLDLEIRDPRRIDVYVNTGGARSVAAGRVSYSLDWRGPSVSMDTACSSSLVALHQAIVALREGECDIALAGGVNLVLQPDFSIGFSQAGMLAPDGRCKAFDARADGFVRSDGVALVALKRLADAQADGDPVRAVILGSAVTNDGQSSGLLMTPGREGQEAVLREAYRRAGVSPGAVHYIEAHGTGTSVGDPIEAAALGAVMGEGRPAGKRCRLGSVKSNIGHTEGAAGMAGLIKVVLAMEQGLLPASLHCHEPNPRIPWQELPVEMQTESGPWPLAGGERALAGVSSFGISGTNAHVVVEQAAEPIRGRPAEVDGPVVLPLSAASAAALAQRAQQLLETLEARPRDFPLADLGYTLAVRRSHFEHRLAVVANSTAEAAEGLAAFRAGESRANLATGAATTTERPRVAFLFPGQGSQWLAMGRRLAQQEPAFRAALESCDEAIARHAGWSVLAELEAGEATSRLEEVDVVQPLIFALQVSLAALWRSWGVEPDAVVGQSLGEVAAAHVAGALDLDDAARVICRRSKLVKTTSGRGGMAAVELSLEEARERIAHRADRVSVAVSNGPRSTVLSGETEALGEILAELERDGVFGRLIKVDYASHSPQMDPLREALLAELEPVRPRPGSVPIYSTVSAEVGDGADFDCHYWVRNLREPVLFAPCLEKLLDHGHTVLLEVSAHPIVLSALKTALHHWQRRALCLPSLVRDGDRGALLASLGALYCEGYPVAWTKLFAPGGRCLRLPSYPWQRESYWIDPEGPGKPLERGSAAPSGGHPLLGWRLESALHAGTRFWQTEIALERQSFLADHRVQGAVVLPAAAYLEAALAAAEDCLGAEAAVELAGVEFEQALFLAPGQPRRSQLALSPDGEGAFQFRFLTAREDGWLCHSRGRVRGVLEGESGGDLPALEAARGRCRQEADSEAPYRQLEALGLEYGPSFRRLAALHRGDGEAVAALEPAEGGLGGSYRLDPTLLDAGFQLLAAALGEAETGGKTLLPVRLEKLRFFPSAGPPAWCWARLEPMPAGEELPRGSVSLFDSQGALVAEAKGLALARLASAEEPRSLFHQILWQEAPLEAAAAAPPASSWLLVGGPAELAGSLRSALEHAGQLVEATAGPSLPPGGPWQHVISLAALEVPALGQSPDQQALEFAWRAAQLVQGLVSAPGPRPGLWLITRGAVAPQGEAPSAAPQAVLWGLGRTLRNEHPELACRLVDLDPSWTGGERLAAELLAGSEEAQVCLRRDGRFAARLSAGLEGGARAAAGPPARTLSAREPFRLEALTPGVLDGLALTRCARRPPGPGQVEVLVRAAGLNFMDLMRAMGIYPGQPDGALALGVECAGTVVAVGPGAERFRPGDEVVGITPSHNTCIASYTTLDERCVAPRPAGLDPLAAATLPVAYLTAYYSLCHLARLAPGERVLIHSATGGVGLAACHLARQLGAEVLATAGSEARRAYLRELGIEHVFDSRSLGFAAAARAATAGKGVDVVLNSLAGEAIPEGLACLATAGRFVELGKRDIYQSAQLSLLPFKRNLAFFAVDIDLLCREQPAFVGRMLQEAMALVASGAVPPLPSHVYSIAEAHEAFRLMAQARHLGKVVLHFDRPEVSVQEPAGRAATLSAERSYLVTGGLGGLGLQVAGWLADHGARKLALLGRSAPGEEARALVASLAERGVEVLTLAADVADAGAVDHAVSRIEAELAPLAGVVHAAGLLADRTLVSLSEEDFARVFAPKVRGAWLLGERTRGCPLDFFVLFSSAAAALGSPGQANYSAANAYLDALAAARQGEGLPGLAIAWGPWSEVGLAARPDRGGRLARRGFGSLSPAEGLEAFGELLASRESQVVVTPFELGPWQQFYPQAASDPFFSTLGRAEEPATGASEGLSAASLARLPAAEREARLREYLRELVARVLGLPAARLEDDRPVNRLGMDSLMAVETRNRVEMDLGVSVPVVTLLQGATLRELTERIQAELGASPAGSAAPPPAGPGEPGHEVVAEIDLEALSEGQVDSLLRDLLESQGSAP